jgi:hypothetical protein
MNVVSEDNLINAVLDLHINRSSCLVNYLFQEMIVYETLTNIHTGEIFPLKEGVLKYKFTSRIGFLQSSLSYDQFLVDYLMLEKNGFSPLTIETEENIPFNSELWIVVKLYRLHEQLQQEQDMIDLVWPIYHLL